VASFALLFFAFSLGHDLVPGIHGDSGPGQPECAFCVLLSTPALLVSSIVLCLISTKGIPISLVRFIAPALPLWETAWSLRGPPAIPAYI
jgi:hypothetical protein